MAELDLSVTLKLIDDFNAQLKSSVSKAITETNKLKTASESSYKNMSKSVENLSVKFKESSTELKNLGRNISQIGNTITLVGGAISAIFIKALSDSSKYSQEVRDSIQSLNVVSSQFSIIIAQAVVPIVNKLTLFLSEVLNTFRSLSPELRNSILQWTFMGGVILLAIGPLVSLTGTMLKFASSIKAVIAGILAWSSANLALIPQIVLITAGIAGLLFLMYKFKPVSTFVLNAFQILFKNIQLQIEVTKAYFNSFIAVALDGVAEIISASAKIDVIHSKSLVNTANAIHGLATEYKITADKSVFEIKRISKEMGELFKGKEGSFALNFDNAKSSIENIIKTVQGIGKGTKLDIFPKGLDQSKIISQQQENQIRITMSQELANLEREINNKSLLDWEKITLKKISLLQDLKRTSLMTASQIGEGFVNSLGRLGSALGQATSMSKGFAKAQQAIALVQAIINTALAITMARRSAPPPFNYILAAIEAAAGAVQIGVIASQKFHRGGFIRAHDGLAVDEVPIIAQTGEGILSRRGMNALGGEQNLNRLNKGQSITEGDINLSINVNYPQISKEQDIKQLADMLGFEIQRQLRYARG